MIDLKILNSIEKEQQSYEFFEKITAKIDNFRLELLEECEAYEGRSCYPSLAIDCLYDALREAERLQESSRLRIEYLKSKSIHLEKRGLKARIKKIEFFKNECEKDLYRLKDALIRRNKGYRYNEEYPYF